MSWGPINFKRILFRAMPLPFFFFCLCLFSLLYFTGGIVAETAGENSSCTSDLLGSVCSCGKKISGSSVTVHCCLHVERRPRL